ncbi:MAG TPA: hypothetical protein PK530_22360 [Anaerolineales bacterium]|nr:hypothetical protein [Anaerolineales bacterium]
MFTKTFFRLGLACLVLAQMVVPTLGMRAAPVRNVAQETQTSLQTGFSRPSLPGLDCDPGTGGSSGGCGGG